MLRFTILLLICLQCTSVFAQDLSLHDNGLIYSSETIEQVRKMVDSITIISKKELKRDYYSIEQGIFHIVILLEENWPRQKNDIAAKMSYADFIKKYPKTQRRDNVHISRQGNPATCYYFYTQQLDPSDRIQIDALDSNINYPDTAMSFFNSGYRSRSQQYFFPAQTFRQLKLPTKYSLKIKYCAALFDTTIKGYANKGFSCFSDIKMITDTAPAVKRFLSYAKTQKQVDDSYLSKLDDAIYEAMEFMQPVPELEEYVSRLRPQILYLQLLLKTQRSFVVTGDDHPYHSPRKLAVKIATMAAAERNLGLFLRMHLDLETDNFRRPELRDHATEHGHYLKELQAVNINLPDLLIGIVLSATTSTSYYHTAYYGLIDAIAACDDPKPILKEIFAAITNKDLDIVNRISLYGFYKSIIQTWTGIRKTEGLEVLNLARKTLPSYYHEQRKLEY